jgi:hypothetical protein
VSSRLGPSVTHNLKFGGFGLRETTNEGAECNEQLNHSSLTANALIFTKVLYTDLLFQLPPAVTRSRG